MQAKLVYWSRSIQNNLAKLRSTRQDYHFLNLFACVLCFSFFFLSLFSAIFLLFSNVISSLPSCTCLVLAWSSSSLLRPCFSCSLFSPLTFSFVLLLTLLSLPQFQTVPFLFFVSPLPVPVNFPLPIFLRRLACASCLSASFVLFHLHESCFFFCPTMPGPSGSASSP